MVNFDLDLKTKIRLKFFTRTLVSCFLRADRIIYTGDPGNKTAPELMALIRWQKVNKGNVTAFKPHPKYDHCVVLTVLPVYQARVCKCVLTYVHVCISIIPTHAIFYRRGFRLIQRCNDFNWNTKVSYDEYLYCYSEQVKREKQ